MDKIIQPGTEVLIFNYNPNWGPKQDEELYIKGIVESSEILEEPTMHGSPWMIRFYKVIGEDNDIYYGTYDVNIKGSHYFRTIPDHIDKVKHKIKDNCEQINKLNHDNLELYELISKLNYELYKNKSLIEETNNTTPYKEYKSLEEQTIALAKTNAKRYQKTK